MIKTEFIKVMAALEGQFRRDEKYCEDLSSVLGFESGQMYNNKDLVDCVIYCVAREFSKPGDAEALINNYMYDYDFGSAEGAGISCASDLWDIMQKECQQLKNRDMPCEEEPELDDIERIFKNVSHIIDMYRKSLSQNGSRSERLNIVNALNINIDFLKKLTDEDYKAKFDEKKFDRVMTQSAHPEVLLTRERS